MSTIPPFIKHWQAILPSQRIEIGLVCVKITYDRRVVADYSDQDMKYVNEIVRDSFHSIAERRGGKLFSWDADGGAFMFLIEGDDSFDNCCLAAIQIAENVPSLNQDIRVTGEVDRPIATRILCDAGTVTYQPEASDHRDDFVSKLLKHERQAAIENRVTITDRVYRRLTRQFKSRFVTKKYSPELEIDLHRTIPWEVPAKAGVPPAGLIGEQPAPAQINVAPGSFLPKTPVVDAPDSPAAVADTPGTPGRLAPLLSRKWLVVGALVLLLLLLGGFLYTVAVPTTPARTEFVQSEEWRTWRNQVHQKLSTGKITEKTLAEAMNIKLPARPEHAPAALRRDLAIADVLMSYPDVQLILKNRFGIYEDSFLGTGLSKPVNAPNYGAATVHEYLIPNHPDWHSAVWMRVLDPINNPQDMTKTVQEILEGDPKPDDKKAQLVKGIVQRVKEKDAVRPAVVRFAILNSSDYSHKLGRSERHRVFASNLAEVWNTRLRDAADLSGHKFTKGESMYVLIFLPSYPDEVVLATWGDVLHWLPQWLSELDQSKN
jgi:hypothetical protein